MVLVCLHSLRGGVRLVGGSRTALPLRTPATAAFVVSATRPFSSGKAAAARNEQSLVDDALVDEFQTNGAVLLKGVFESSWMKKLADGVKWNMDNPSPNGEYLKVGKGTFFNDYCNWRDIPSFNRFIRDTPAAQMAAELMKSTTAVFYHEHVLVKEPGAGKPTPWHHDLTYYPVRGTQLCSFWIPIDPVPLENSLQFVQGSHAWGQLFHPRKFATELNYPLNDSATDDKLKEYSDVPDIDGNPEKYNILSWEVEPGDCVVFHMQTLHAATGNHSDQSRRIFALRWFGDDARFTDRPWDVSPPYTAGLKEGDQMECDLFPRLWPSP